MSEAKREVEAILGLWFGELDEHGMADDEHAARWWKKDSDFDRQLRDTYAGLREALLRGERSDWPDDARGQLAAVLVLDQFSRNIHRDTPEMYAADERALALSLAAIEKGEDRALPGDMRAFFYLPSMHSEELAMQERCVELFEAFRDSVDEPLRTRLDSNLRFAIMHRDIVARFGRFPHRNAILGRESTDEEIAFLQEPGSSF